MMIDRPEPWLVIGPLLGAIAAFLYRRGGGAIGLIAVVLNGWAAVSLVSSIRENGVLDSYVGDWQPPLGIAFHADGLTATMIILTALIALGTAIYAVGYFNRRVSWFWSLFLMTVAAANALFLSRDIFNIYVTLELLGLGSVTLIALADEAKALGAALRYFFVSMLGSLCYLLGTALLYGAHGTVDLELLRAALTAPSTVTAVAAGLMTAGLLLKTALFPMHFWLPPAHANAPVPVSALLSGLVVKASFYVVMRLWLEMFPVALIERVAPIFGVLGGAAVLWGGAQALLQERLKLVVAYSTVVQVGYFFLVFPLAVGSDSRKPVLEGIVVLLLAHAISKSAAFFAAGNIMRAHGTDRLDALAVASRSTPTAMFALGLAAVSLSGLPPSGGFIAKWRLLGASIEGGQWWWTALLAGGGLLTAGYFFRVLKLAFSEHEKAPAPIPVSMEWTALLFAIGGIALGFLGPTLVEWAHIGAPLGTSMEGTGK